MKNMNLNDVINHIRLFIFIVYTLVLSSCVNDEVKCHENIFVSNQKLEDWIKYHNDKFIEIDCISNYKIANKYFLKKQLKKLYLVEVSRDGLVANYFPVMSNLDKKAGFDSIRVSSLFPSPNVLQKELVINSWLNFERDTLFANFNYSPSNLGHIEVGDSLSEINSSEHCVKFCISLSTGNARIDFEEKSTSIW